MTTKTDTDGKFTVQIPRKGRVGLAATAKRILPNGSQENYYWLVWVMPEGKPTGQVSLSNDNIWGADSPQMVVTPDAAGSPLDRR